MNKEKLEIVKVPRNGMGDTRTATTIPTMDTFVKANSQHAFTVWQFCSQFAKILDHRGMMHDHTKFDYEDEFYRDFCECLKSGDKHFTNMHWYDDIHIVQERHHLLSNCPEDVNLIDVFEMVIDCVCAGMARSGKVRPLEISNDILQKAIENTANEIKEAIVLVDQNEWEK